MLVEAWDRANSVSCAILLSKCFSFFSNISKVERICKMLSLGPSAFFFYFHCYQNSVSSKLWDNKRNRYYIIIYNNIHTLYTLTFILFTCSFSFSFSSNNKASWFLANYSTTTRLLSNYRGLPTNPVHMGKNIYTEICDSYIIILKLTIYYFLTEKIFTFKYFGKIKSAALR